MNKILNKFENTYQRDLPIQTQVTSNNSNDIFRYDLSRAVYKMSLNISCEYSVNHEITNPFLLEEVQESAKKHLTNQIYGPIKSSLNRLLWAVRNYSPDEALEIINEIQELME